MNGCSGVIKIGAQSLVDAMSQWSIVCKRHSKSLISFEGSSLISYEGSSSRQHSVVLWQQIIMMQVLHLQSTSVLDWTDEDDQRPWACVLQSI